MNSSFQYPAPFRHRSYIPQILLPACVLASLVVPNFATAATKTWVGSTSTDWATGANWNAGTVPVTADVLTFGAAGTQGTSLTNTLTSGSFNVAGITFSTLAPAYDFSGNSFNLTAGITNNSNSQQTFNNTGGLTNSAASATFVVSAAGGTTISNGLTNTLNAAQTLTVNGAGGSLNLGGLTLNSGAATTTTTLSGSGNINITGAVANGGIGTNAVTVINTGTVTFAGANTNTGLVSIGTTNGTNGATANTVGNLVISGDQTGATGGVYLASGSTLNLKTAKAFGGTFTFGGGTVLNGTGSALTLTNATPITMSGGIYGAAANVGGNGDINFGTGAVSYSGVFNMLLLGHGSTFRYDGAVTNISGNSIVGVYGAGNTLVFGSTYAPGAANTNATTFTGAGNIMMLGAVQNGVGNANINFNSTGTLTMAGANTYGGSTGFNAGTVVLDYSGNAGTKISGSGTGGILTLGAVTVNLNGGSTTEAVVSSVLNPGAVAINRTGGGTSVLGLKAITRNVGSTLALGAGGVATTSSGAVNATLKSSLGTVYGVVGGDDWAATAAANGPIVGYSTLSPYASNTGTSFSAGGNNDVGVDTTLAAAGSAATLRFNTAAARNIDLNGNQFQITAGGILVTNAVGNNLTTITGGTLTAGSTNKELVIFQNNTANGLTVASTVADNGANAVTLTKSGAGLLTLANVANTYTGKTFLNQGTLSIAAEGSLGATPVALTADQLTMAGGTLQFGANNIALSANRGVTLIGGGSTINTNGNNATIAGIIAGSSANLTKTGAGTLFLTSTANSFTGPFTISGGVVNAAALANANTASSIGRGGSVSFAGDLILDGGLLQYTGATAATTNRQYTLTNNGGGFDASGTATGLMTLSGAMTASGVSGTQALTLTGTGTGTSAGVLSGTINNGAGTNVTSVNKTGTGTWTLSATNTYTGSTNVSGGTLALASTGSINSSNSIVVSSGATFDVSAVTGGYALANGQTLRGAGSITGAVTAGAGRTIAAGVDANTIGTLTFSSTLNVTAATVSLKLNSSTGVADLIAANGVTLGGATLALIDIGNGTWATGSTFVIFSNTAVFSVSGTFAGLAEGSTINVGSNAFTISYLGGVGANDITLTAASAVPEPSTYAAIFGGVALVGAAFYRRRAKAV